MQQLLLHSNQSKKLSSTLYVLIRSLSLSMALLLLSSCASPAHKNTLAWGNDIHTITVNVHSLGTYEIDGYLVDNKSLRTQIEQLTQSHRLKTMVIIANANASLFDQAFAVYVGEKNGLRTFKRVLFWTEQVSSDELLAELAESNNTTSLEALWQQAHDH